MLRRILDDHYSHATGSIHAKAFVNDTDKQNGELTNEHSVSWEKYTTADALRLLDSNPERFGVAAVKVKEYEAVNQKVEHTPEARDYGHCAAIGPKTAKVKNHLRKSATLKIAPPIPSRELQ